jgi:uncharacterized protein (TIGR02453 family)
MFTAETLSFLRALRRNNNREWFGAHREAYDAHVRAPMTAFVERLAPELARFAGELVASPKVSVYRIHRDTRFSADKSPYKTQAAAVFPCRGLPKHEGAGLYFEIAARHVLVAGGIYAPQPPELQALREHLARHYRRFRAIVESSAFRRAVGGVEGERLQRLPRGFPVNHPAAEYLKLKQLLVWREYPAAFATSPRFFGEIVRRFEQMAPFVRFLNEPLLARARPVDVGPASFTG